MLFLNFNVSSKKYIFLRISEKCSCNCISCNLPKISQNQDISLKKLEIILKYIYQNFGEGFELNFIGYNIFAHKDFKLLLKTDYTLPISIHIDYNDIIKYGDFIKKQQNKFTIQKNIYNTIDFKKAISIIYFIEQNDIGNLEIDFLFSFSNNKYFLSYFLKNFRFDFFDGFRGIFYIGNSKITIENIYSEEFGENCNFTESYICENGVIYIKDNIEICLKTGDIKTHLSSYCNLGIRSLGNIYDSSERVYNNFEYAMKILKENEKRGKKEKCMYCIKNPIKL